MKLRYILLGCWLIVSIFGFVWHFELADTMTKISLQSCKCCQRQLQAQELGFTNGYAKYDMVKGYHLFLYSEITAGLVCFIFLIKTAFKSERVKKWK
jgi:hypothetical protein